MSVQTEATYHIFDLYLETSRAFEKGLTVKRYQARTDRYWNLTQHTVTPDQINGNKSVSDIATRLTTAISSLEKTEPEKLKIKIIINAHGEEGDTILPEFDDTEDYKLGDAVRFDKLAAWLVALGTKHGADDKWTLVITLNVCHASLNFAEPFCKSLHENGLRCFSVTASPHSLSQNRDTGRYFPFLFGVDYSGKARPASWKAEPGAKITFFSDKDGVITKISS